MENIVDILIKRDGLTRREAEMLVQDAKTEFNELMASGDMFSEMDSFCYDWFGLEPDYLEQLF